MRVTQLNWANEKVEWNVAKSNVDENFKFRRNVKLLELFFSAKKSKSNASKKSTQSKIKITKSRIVRSKQSYFTLNIHQSYSLNKK